MGSLSLFITTSAMSSSIIFHFTEVIALARLFELNVMIINHLKLKSMCQLSTVSCLSNHYTFIHQNILSAQEILL